MDSGRLLGSLEEFKKVSEHRFDRLEEKIDHLMTWRWKVIGGATVVSLAVTFGIELIFILGGK